MSRTTNLLIISVVFCSLLGSALIPSSWAALPLMIAGVSWLLLLISSLKGLARRRSSRSAMASEIDPAEREVTND